MNDSPQSSLPHPSAAQPPTIPSSGVSEQPGNAHAGIVGIAALLAMVALVALFIVLTVVTESPIFVIPMVLSALVGIAFLPKVCFEAHRQHSTK